MPMRFAAPLLRPVLRARWMALVCLFAWFVGIPALLPTAVAALGSLDFQHRVALENVSGQIAVVFHHAGIQSSQHRHEPLTQALTAFASSRGATQDHVLTFEQVDSALVPASSSPAAQSPVVAPAVIAHGTVAALSPSRAPVCAPRPPPIRAFALVCLRSTSLRI